MFFSALDKPHKDSRVTRSALALTMRTASRSRELRGGRRSRAPLDRACGSDEAARDACGPPCRRVMSLVVGEERRPLERSEPDEGAGGQPDVRNVGEAGAVLSGRGLQATCACVRREGQVFCIWLIGSMLREWSKDYDDFQRTGRAAEGLQAA